MTAPSIFRPRQVSPFSDPSGRMEFNECPDSAFELHDYIASQTIHLDCSNSLL